MILSLDDAFKITIDKIFPEIKLPVKNNSIKLNCDDNNE